MGGGGVEKLGLAACKTLASAPGDDDDDDGWGVLQ